MQYMQLLQSVIQTQLQRIERYSEKVDKYGHAPKVYLSITHGSGILLTIGKVNSFIGVLGPRQLRPYLLRLAFINAYKRPKFLCGRWLDSFSGLHAFLVGV